MGYGDSSNLAHIVPMLAPVDGQDLTLSTAPIDGGRCAHIEFLVMLGWINNGGTLTIQECDDNAPTTAVATTRWTFRQSAQVGTDFWSPDTAAPAGGVAVGIMDLRTSFLIDIEPTHLSAGFPFVRCTYTDTGGGLGKNPDWLAIIALVTPRYSHDRVTSVLV